MGKKLYVGNLSYETTKADLEKLFAPHGKVETADVIMDRESARGKGFGFVEMSSEAERRRTQPLLGLTTTPALQREAPAFAFSFSLRAVCHAPLTTTHSSLPCLDCRDKVCACL